MHEVTTFRRDVRTDGRHAEVEFGASLDDDLARRDFTINAIAFSPPLEEIRDPFDGQEDIARKIVRAVGDPEARMREDRLRALRAIRFAARFGFAIDDATRRAIESSAPHLGRLSPERVKQELDKTMEQVRCPSAALRLWQSTGAFASLVPALAAVPSRRVRRRRLSRDAGDRRVVRRVGPFALPGCSSASRRRRQGEVLGVASGSRSEIQTVVALVDAWQRYGEAIGDRLIATTVDDEPVRRWVAAIGRLEVGSFMRLAAAVWDAARARAGAGAGRRGGPRRSTGAWSARHFAIRIDLGSLAVDGDDLRRAGIPAGPKPR